jgi:hypothetical protein
VPNLKVVSLEVQVLNLSAPLLQLMCKQTKNLEHDASYCYRGDTERDEAITSSLSTMISIEKAPFEEPDAS